MMRFRLSVLLLLLQLGCLTLALASNRLSCGDISGSSICKDTHRRLDNYDEHMVYRQASDETQRGVPVESIARDDRGNERREETRVRLDSSVRFEPREAREERVERREVREERTEPRETREQRVERLDTREVREERRDARENRVERRGARETRVDRRDAREEREERLDTREEREEQRLILIELRLSQLCTRFEKKEMEFNILLYVHVLTSQVFNEPRKSIPYFIYCLYTNTNPLCDVTVLVQFSFMGNWNTRMDSGGVCAT